ncbi:MAG: lipoyl(octanoyl) transferase LipB [Elusimicrobia bacterium]|nr:lipoyl(octanoyl) transferase LipB [Elusimicrobiota bacterium]
MPILDSKIQNPKFSIQNPKSKIQNLDIRWLGLVDYQEAWELQHDLVEKRARGLCPDTLLLLEHPHVITRGRGYNGKTLVHTDYPIYDIERGGDITYHGPGQLVGYPILHLKERNLLIGHYLRLLEQVLIDSLASFNLSAERLKGFTGVWVRGKKIASIGVAVKSWVSYHGFALNVTTDLSQFQSLYPCGLEPQQMTSLERLLGTSPDLPTVRTHVQNAFRHHFSDKT